MGRERVTVQNLKIVKVDAERGLLLIKVQSQGLEADYSKSENLSKHNVREDF